MNDLPSLDRPEPTPPKIRALVMLEGEEWLVLRPLENASPADRPVINEAAIFARNSYECPLKSVRCGRLHRSLGVAFRLRRIFITAEADTVASVLKLSRGSVYDLPHPVPAAFGNCPTPPTSPKIIQAIAGGTASAGLTVSRLTQALPHTWTARGQMLGVS